MTTPTFTRDWITDKTPAWRDHVVPRISGLSGAKWIEVGSYQGRSALWTLDNVLLGPGSLLYCVDIFEPRQAGLERWGDPQTDYVEIFDALVGCRPNVVKLKGRSRNVLPVLQGTRFCGAYVDADHCEDSVRADLRLLWPLLIPGAVCVLDDYGFDDPGTRIVVDEILANRRESAQLLHKGFQVILLKTGEL
jgi:hypothetical protein